MPNATTAVTSPDPRLAAIAARDPAADGAFVYSVRTTGVYCRPSCPSRHARPENVALHADWRAAEAAGFRPCKRCDPRGAEGDGRATLIAEACRTIEAAEDEPSLDALARQAGLSPAHFQRVFKAATGLTPRGYAAALRAARVRDALKGGDRSVTEAMYEAGYNSSGRFYADAPGTLGMTPSTYRDHGLGAAIQYAIGACSLGVVLVASTASGVCAILLGDEPEALVRDLRSRFSKADIAPAYEAYDRVVAQVVALIETPRLGLNLPLDIRGTAFQQRVWTALGAIRPGETATYADIAAAIGFPSAARAVAGACGANPVAVAIPCHRVVRADGGLSGYRWGTERKRTLLARERE